MWQTHNANCYYLMASRSFKLDFKTMAYAFPSLAKTGYFSPDFKLIAFAFPSLFKTHSNFTVCPGW